MIEDSRPVVFLTLVSSVVVITDARPGSLFPIVSSEIVLTDLDGIPGLVPGLVPGFQGWKCPGTLAQPCSELKSLKFILSDSNFLCPPALNTLVTLGIYPVCKPRIFLPVKLSIGKRSF